MQSHDPQGEFQMSILITGSTGVIGTQVIANLLGKSVQIGALTRSPEKTKLPDGVRAVKGDLADVDSVRAAMSGVSTLFLLVPNVADELTQAMQALSIAKEAGVKGIVYLSVFKAADSVEVPHFASKYTVEQMIKTLDLPVSILRAAYFIQNDLRQKDALLGKGLYTSQLGDKGISMVDTRDIGEAAADEILRRERSPIALARETFEMVGPDAMTSKSVAAVWTEVLQRPIRPVGNDLDALERQMKTFLPSWHALDLRLMFHRYQVEGAVANPEEIARFAQLLGHQPRSYREFAKSVANAWTEAPIAA
jgi:uncharacterized protein YbjT (DUF2867 family)